MKTQNSCKWWKKTVVYQIYPKSFKDSNGDGIGDINGMIDRLDYLKDLGIGAVWLSPVCRSPQDDNGYDISDYQDIDPMFGTMEDMKRLIEEAGKRGIRIILDLVLNHTSDEHPWFKEAVKGKDNPYHDYYVWRDGEEGCPPNEMRACFGGSAWQWVPELGQYYFHQFSVKQPDLNWDNPKVREEIIRMINWWMDQGVGGFRLDVIDQIAKEPDLEITGNGPMLHAYIRELSRNTFQKGDLITVGEAWGANTENARVYSSPDGSEFSMVFQFEHSGLDQQPGKAKWDLAPLDFVKLKKVLAKWQTSLHEKGWNSLFWNNHDLPRIVSRWGNDGEYRVESAKMLATILYGMQGTPYLYQGEELAMTNVRFDISEYRDIEIMNMYRERLEMGFEKEEIMESIYAKGRDNARTPMQWDDTEHAGFTSGTPWLKVNPNYTEINAKKQINDQDSVFSYYKSLIRLRKTYDIFVEGDFRLLYEEDADIFAYVRSFGSQKILVAANFHGGTAAFKMPEEMGEKGRVLIGNYKNREDGILRPYEAFMILMDGE
ncbi:alpha,alpha-phosphotrehalase [Clostridium sp. MCC353]|uniref:glycoside hydrolase family 13 protein n=1 Tax=Clostridium sp. MCC353 TaxID=2592646 RepID=UPI001C01BD67|nr:alpha-glucosidase [Clostridium sp. MCC353]MBT9775249.1 alpha,alpha-phosphotrehalase [Clostridium sp. MCC353]